MFFSYFKILDFLPPPGSLLALGFWDFNLSYCFSHSYTLDKGHFPIVDA